MIDEEAGDDEEEGGEWPETLVPGDVYFHDLRRFCAERRIAAVQVTEDGGIWLYRDAGGPPVRLSDWRPEGANVTPIKAPNTKQ